MKNIMLLVFALCVNHTISAQWLTNIESAAKQAKEESKLILLNFSGSDWCAPCVKMKSDFFEYSPFEKFAETNLVLLNADFPRRQRKLHTKDQIAHNEKLAEQYNKTGEFPKTLLLNAEGEIMATWAGYPNYTPDDFIRKLRSHLPVRAHDTGSVRVFNKSEKLMGSRFDITVVEHNWPKAEKHILAAIDEIKRIEDLISSWDINSQTTQINEMAGIYPVKVDSELIGLIERSMNISRLTQGAFDITFGSVDKRIWQFTDDMKSLPGKADAARSVALINYHNIEIDHTASTVFLKEKGMRLGFGAIGKGYAADMAKKLLEERGVTNGIVNAGGDLVAWGKQPNGKPWSIGLANPNQYDDLLSKIELTDQAIVTSGNYEKYIEIDGKKYCHIIDPRTGYPVEGLKSVSIICKKRRTGGCPGNFCFCARTGNWPGPHQSIGRCRMHPGGLRRWYPFFRKHKN